jgi:hypothetical protein
LIRAIPTTSPLLLISRETAPEAPAGLPISVRVSGDRVDEMAGELTATVDRARVAAVEAGRESEIHDGVRSVWSGHPRHRMYRHVIGRVSGNHARIVDVAGEAIPEPRHRQRAVAELFVVDERHRRHRRRGDGVDFRIGVEPPADCRTTLLFTGARE